MYDFYRRFNFSTDMALESCAEKYSMICIIIFNDMWVSDALSAHYQRWELAKHAFDGISDIRDTSLYFFGSSA